MAPELEARILAHTQAVARNFLAWRGSLESLIPFIVYSMGTDAPSPEDLDLFLRKESTQRLLQSKYETALWKATDKTYRLICIAIPLDPEVVKRRLARFPTSTNQCRFCQIDEKSFAYLELKPELDIRRELVPASYLHPHCQRSWLLMRALVERADISPPPAPPPAEPIVPIILPPVKRGPGRPRKSP